MEVIFTLISYLLKIVNFIKTVENAQPALEESKENWHEIYDRWAALFGKGE